MEDPLENKSEDSTCNLENKQEENQELSKRQMKKLAKRQKWLQNKGERRAKERATEKRKRQEAKEKGEDLGPSRKALKMSKMEFSKCKVNIIIDLGLGDFMTDREISKLVKQIQRCYAINRRSENPAQFYLTNHGGKIKDKMDASTEYQNWDVNVESRNFEEVFNPSDVVYLTGDSENVIEKLEDGKAYIIGGLVDHNRLKNACIDRAKEKKVSHAKLPISENVSLKTSHILTVDQVFTILLRLTEEKSWKEALSEIIPQRKIQDVQ